MIGQIRQMDTNEKAPTDKTNTPGLINSYNLSHSAMLVYKPNGNYSLEIWYSLESLWKKEKSEWYFLTVKGTV